MKIFSLKKGDPIVETLTKKFESLDVCGYFSAIGAVSWAKLKIYNLDEKEYYDKELEGSFEVCNLTGIVAKLDGKTVIHPHIALSDKDFKVFGGHLEEARVSATLEVCFFENEEIEREYNEEIGLNLLK